MKSWKVCFLIGCWLLIINTTFGQSIAPKRVLFVGNSYTYFWNLPQTVGLMSAAKDVEMTTRQSTAGGSNLGQHWRGEKKLKTVDIIKENDFDAIILQDHSLRTIQALDSMLYYGKKLGKLIRKKKAKAYVYMTWAREWNPLMQEKITEGYLKLGKEIGAEVVPVGLAWQLARQLRPELKLYDPDGSHPSSIGTYLSGCVFFGVLTGQSPVGLPPRLMTKDKDGEKIYLTILSPNDAAFCQEVAKKTIEMFQKR